MNPLLTLQRPKKNDGMIEDNRTALANPIDISFTYCIGRNRADNELIEYIESGNYL